MKTTRHAPDKIKFWTRHIDGWKASGLHQKEYCAKRGIGLKSFGRWKQIVTKLQTVRGTATTPCIPNSPKELIPISLISEAASEALVANASGNAGIRLYVGNNKYAIDLAVGFHPPTLQTLLNTLG